VVAANNGRQSFANCVKSGTDYFSLQNGLKAISGGRLGNSWLSSAFLSSNISNFITLGQFASSFFSGGSGPSLGDAASAGGQLAAGDVAQGGLKSVPNVSIQASASATVAVQTPTSSATFSAAGRFSANLPFGTFGGKAASALGTLAVYKYAIDIPVAAFSAIVCSVGR